MTVYLLQKLQDVDDIDLVSSYQFNTEIEIFQFGFDSMTYFLVHIIIELEIPGLIVHEGLFIHEHIKIRPVKFSEGQQCCISAIQCTKLTDEISLIVLRDQLCTIIRSLHDTTESFGILPVFRQVILVSLHQEFGWISILRIKLQGLILCFLDIPVCDDLTVLFGRLVHTVRTGISLQKGMVDQILIQNQRVCRFGIKSGQEHVHDEQKINLRKIFLLQTL